MRKSLLAIVAASAAFGTAPAHAVDTTVPFTALVTSSCVLTVGTPGLLGADDDFSQLSSKNAGGVPGTVTAVTTGAGFEVSAIAPTSFSQAPAGGNDDVTFAATYEASGATSIGEILGDTASSLNFGITSMTVNLEANKSAGAFPAGAYTAEVIVRCE
ncbi:MAG: hypothetical protein AB7E80_03365 [Hyphomicrobiaceae bacterium]